MNRMNNKVVSLARIDLNLFRVFATIYRERNLTRASEQLFLSQPAVSHALSRLRANFDDQLFIRDGHGVVPTPLAKRLWPSIEQSLNLMQQAVQSTLDFQPERDIQQLTIAMIVEVEPLFYPLVVQQFLQFNPEIQISCVRIDRKNLRQELSSGRIDFAVDVAQVVESGIAFQQCIQDHFVVLSRDNHPLIDKGLSKDTYTEAQHITVSARPTGRVFEDFFLSKQGIKRKISLRCQQYQTAINLVTKTDGLLTIPKNQIAYFKEFFPQIRIHPLPFEVNGFEFNLYWDEQKTDDPQTKWCKDQLLNAMAISKENSKRL